MNHPAITKSLQYLSSKEGRTVWMRAFHLWQRRPYEVTPLSSATHVCASCATPFTGNFCPRCGQAAAVGRFSFKKAALLFLDVWGLGNRSMFRSLRDLMFRPGYMIRDYLRGMQSAYFPPFKMFFLLTAFSLLVGHGFSLFPDSPETPSAPEAPLAPKATSAQEASSAPKAPEAPGIPEGIDVEEVESPLYTFGLKFGNMMDTLRERNPAIFALVSLVMFSLPLYFFLRHSPSIPDLRYSEFVVALVYTANAYSIYSIVGNILNSEILKLIAVLIVLVAFKQLSGYSKRRVLAYAFFTTIISALIIAALAGTGISIAYLLYGSPE